MTKRTMIASWPKGGAVARNWGDKLNPYLIERLSGFGVLNADELASTDNVYVHCVIGSMLGHVRYRNAVIWGAGFIAAADKLQAAPKAVFAVRGHLTQHLLRRQGALRDTVAVGDPALLMPLVYSPQPVGDWRIGFIPHFRDSGTPLARALREESVPDILLIDILGEIEEVCDRIKSCSVILSSSLHGLIAAHAYGIPALYVKISDNPIGDGFKYFDYFSTIIGNTNVYRNVKTIADLRSLSAQATQAPILPDLERLLACCPFLSPDRKRLFIERIRSSPRRLV
jgi:pyruvyltransferase